MIMFIVFSCTIFVWVISYNDMGNITFIESSNIGSFYNDSKLVNQINHQPRDMFDKSHSKSISNKDLHSNFDWNWYEQNILNTSKKEILCGPPNLDDTKWKQQGYSLIECYINPTFDPDLVKLKIIKKGSVMWQLIDYDVRNVSIYTMCKLYNVMVEWIFSQRPYLNINANCIPTNNQTLEDIENKFKRNINNKIDLEGKFSWSSDETQSPLTIQSEPIHSNNDGLVYHHDGSVAQCGQFMFNGQYAFANPVRLTIY